MNNGPSRRDTNNETRCNTRRAEAGVLAVANFEDSRHRSAADADAGDAQARPAYCRTSAGVRREHTDGASGSGLWPSVFGLGTGCRTGLLARRFPLLVEAQVLIVLAVLSGCQSHTPPTTRPLALTAPPRAILRPQPPIPPMPPGARFQPASALARPVAPVAPVIPSLNSPAWATNLLPSSYRITKVENPAIKARWILSAQCTVPANRYPIRLSVEFLDTVPYPGWVCHDTLTLTGPTVQPTVFDISVNVDSATNGVRVMSD